MTNSNQKTPKNTRNIQYLNKYHFTSWFLHFFLSDSLFSFYVDRPNLTAYVMQLGHTLFIVEIILGQI